MKKATMSNCKNAGDRSKKTCVCGFHSIKAKRSKRNKVARVKPPNKN